jgi:hypothetical protein
MEWLRRSLGLVLCRSTDLFVYGVYFASPGPEAARAPIGVKTSLIRYTYPAFPGSFAVALLISVGGIGGLESKPEEKSPPLD